MRRLALFAFALGLFMLLALSVWMLNRAVDRMDSILIAFNRFIDFIMK